MPTDGCPALGSFQPKMARWRHPFDKVEQVDLVSRPARHQRPLHHSSVSPLNDLPVSETLRRVAFMFTAAQSSSAVTGRSRVASTCRACRLQPQRASLALMSESVAARALLSCGPSTSRRRPCPRRDTTYSSWVGCSHKRAVECESDAGFDGWGVHSAFQGTALIAITPHSFAVAIK